MSSGLPVRSGLSLVEVLVVVLILGLLTAVLFPVLSSSIRQAHRSDETFAMRQFGIAKGLYDADNDSNVISVLSLSEAGYLQPSLLHSRRDRFDQGYGRWLTGQTYGLSASAASQRHEFSYSMIDFSGDTAFASRVFRKMESADLPGLGWVVNLLDRYPGSDNIELRYPELNELGVVKRLLTDGSVRVSPQKTKVTCLGPGDRPTTTGMRLMFFFDRRPEDLAYVRDGRACLRSFLGDGGNYFE